MQGVLIFNTEEPFEHQSFIRATKADACYSIFWSMLNEDAVSNRFLNLGSVHELRRELYEVLSEEGINIDLEYT
jgi:hypothetical protein